VKPIPAGLIPGVPLPVVAVAVAVAATLLGDSMLYAVMPSRPDSWGLAIPAVGVLLSANRLVRLLTNPVAALAFDRLGPRIPFIGALAAAVAVTLAYGWFTAFTILLAARLVWGTAWSMLRLGGFWTVLEEATDANRGLLMGSYSAIVRLGSVAGALLGAILTETFGHRPTLTGFAVVMALAGLGWIAATHGDRVGRRVSVRPVDEGGPGMLAAMRERRLLATGGGALLTGLVFSGLVTASLGFFLTEHFGERVGLLGIAIGTTSATGILLGLQWSLGLPLAPVIGHLSDRLGRVRVTSAGFVIGAGGLVALAVFSEAALVLGAVLTAFAAATILGVGLAATAGDLAPPERRSAVMSGYATFLDVGAALGPLVGLAFASLATLRGLYVAAALLLLLAGAGFRLGLGKDVSEAEIAVRARSS